MSLVTVELGPLFFAYLAVELALLLLLWRWYLRRPVKSAMTKAIVALATLLVVGPLVFIGCIWLAGRLLAG